MDAGGLPPLPPRPDAVEPRPDTTPGRDRMPLVVIGTVLLLMGAVIAGLVVTRGGEEPPANLSRRPSTGGTEAVYRLEVDDDAEPTEEAPEGVSFEIDATLTITPGDTATEVRVDDVAARYNGEAMRAALTEPQTVHLSEQNLPDAVVLVGTDSTGTFLYFVDMMFPVVRSGTLTEGDSWPVSLEATVPAATGSATYEGTGELIGYEDVDGTNAAQVRNDLTLGYDYTVIAAEAAELAGGSAESGTIHVSGTGSMTITGWIDPATGVVLRSSIEGSYDVSFAYRDFASDEIRDADIPSIGDFTMRLELQPDI